MKYVVTMKYPNDKVVFDLHMKYFKPFNPVYATLYVAADEYQDMAIVLDMEPEDVTCLALAINATIKPLTPEFLLDYMRPITKFIHGDKYEGPPIDWYNET